MKKYFKDTSNLVSFALGAIMSFIFFIFNREMKVPIWVLLIIVFLFVITIWLLVKSRIELKELSPNTQVQIIECSHNVCLCKPNKLATTSSTGGLSLALQRAIVTARPKGRYRKHFYWPAIKRYYWNLLFSIPLLAHLYISELLHLLYCQLFQHNIL